MFTTIHAQYLAKIYCVCYAVTDTERTYDYIIIYLYLYGFKMYILSGYIGDCYEQVNTKQLNKNDLYQIFNSAFKDAHIVYFQQYWSHKHNYTSSWHIDKCRSSRVETFEFYYRVTDPRKKLLSDPFGEAIRGIFKVTELTPPKATHNLIGSVNWRTM